MIKDNLFNFCLEKWCVNLADSERNACSNQVGEKFVSVNLISELDKGVEMVLKLRLQRLIPVLIRDVLRYTLT